MASNLDPGSPALHVTNAPSASIGSGGTTMESATAFKADAAHGVTFTPNTTFAYDVGNGCTQTFYKGIPVSINQALKTKLITAGLGS